MQQCNYFIKRKRRRCSHLVVSAGDTFCSLHQADALEDSRKQDQGARDYGEIRELLIDLVGKVEVACKSSTDPDTITNELASLKRSRNRRISAPGRMANPDSLRLCPSLGNINWNDIFADTLLPMYIDVGCARGRAIERLSMRPERRQWNHLGIEIRPEVVKESMQFLAKARTDDPSLPRNLHFLAFNFAATAADFFSSLPPGVARVISFQFPDPWRTKKYLRRRIIQRELVEVLVPRLAPRGCIYVSSDSHHLAVHMKTQLAQHPGLRMLEASSTMDWEAYGLYPKALAAKGITETTGPLRLREDDMEGEVDALDDDGHGWLDFNPLVNVFILYLQD